MAEALDRYVAFTDQQLCNLLRQNDLQAFNAIYDRYWRSLYQSASGFLHVAAQAEDIVQDLFVNLWLKREAYAIDNLSAYLRKALRSRLLNYVLRDKVKASFFEPFDAIQRASFSAEELIREKELLEVIAAYIRALPLKRKEIFLLHYKDQLSTGEIANLLGISQKTVQNQLNTTFNGLRSTITSLLLLALTHLS